MTLGEFNDAIAAYNAAHEEKTGPVLTDAEADDLATMMGIE